MGAYGDIIWGLHMGTSYGDGGRHGGIYGAIIWGHHMGTWGGHMRTRGCDMGTREDTVASYGDVWGRGGVI